MPKFQVEALVRGLVRTWYLVEADSPEEAELHCRAGEAEAEHSEVEEGEEEWVETVSVDPILDPHS